MRKYLAFTRNEFANVFIYRGAVLLWMLSNIITLVVIVAVWQAAQAGQSIAGFTKAELITYYIMGFFFQWITIWLPAYGVSSEIRDGDLAVTNLIKPLSYFWEKFFTEIGWHSFATVLGLALTVILALTFKGGFILNLSGVTVVCTALAVLLTALVTFTLSFCIGLLSFWVSDIWALDGLFWAGRGFLGGAILPISFIPGVLQKIVDFLPFRYTFAFPVEVYLGRLSLPEFIGSSLIAVSWIALFVLLYKVMWRAGRKIYVSYGQ
jgi:ABC-2 type transport system permease protein